MKSRVAMGHFIGEVTTIPLPGATTVPIIDHEVSESRAGSPWERWRNWGKFDSLGDYFSCGFYVRVGGGIIYIYLLLSVLMCWYVMAMFYSLAKLSLVEQNYYQLECNYH